MLNVVERCRKSWNVVEGSFFLNMQRKLEVKCFGYDVTYADFKTLQLNDFEKKIIYNATKYCARIFLDITKKNMPYKQG